ncbi:MAG: hypothetical protein AB1489_40840, partial [Acidobacteriota bacterium]
MKRDLLKTTKPMAMDGFALAVVMLIMLVLLMLATSVLISTATNATITGNYRASNETFSVANVGLEKLINWFTTVYSPEDRNVYASRSTFDIKYNDKDVTLFGIARPVSLLTDGGTISNGGPEAIQAAQAGGIDSNGGPAPSDIDPKPVDYDDTRRVVPASNFPDINIIESFRRDFSEQQLLIENKNYGNYSADAKLLSITVNELPFGNGKESVERWQLDVKATAPNNNQSTELRAVIEISTPSYFGYAIKTDDRLKVSDNVLIDGYDSRKGSYSPFPFTTNRLTKDAPVASNNDIKFDGHGVRICGDADYYDRLDCQHSPKGKYHLPCKDCDPNKLEQRLLFDPVDFDKKCGPAGETTLVAVSFGEKAIPPGCYKNIMISAGRLVLTSGDYFIENLSMSAGEVVLNLDSKKNPVRFYVRNKLSMSSGRFGLKQPTLPLPPPLPAIAAMESPTKLLIAVKELDLRGGEMSAAIYNYSKSDRGGGDDDDDDQDEGDDDDDDDDSDPCGHCHSKHDIADGTADGQDDLGPLAGHPHSAHADLPAQCDTDKDCDGGSEPVRLEGKVNIKNATVYGAIVANRCEMEGTARLHYDLALR